MSYPPDKSVSSRRSRDDDEAYHCRDENLVDSDDDEEWCDDCNRPRWDCRCDAVNKLPVLESDDTNEHRRIETSGSCKLKRSRSFDNLNESSCDEDGGDMSDDWKDDDVMGNLIDDDDDVDIESSTAE